MPCDALVSQFDEELEDIYMESFRATTLAERERERAYITAALGKNAEEPGATRLPDNKRGKQGSRSATTRGVHGRQDAVLASPPLKLFLTDHPDASDHRTGHSTPSLS
ncbi:hypothetical protein JOB18_036008 [Solea senegalensis]|uniref:Uncharacterized protein n=1 Tax=Solea senegalensis TaxID=28829 RepID=A0AAV6SGK6_SOLSE|nr:hypothetical protein JOB18_036008 [Solea senegalensis]